MTKLIAICDTTKRIKSDRFSFRLIDHLETHFGSANSLDRSKITHIKDKRSQATHVFNSSIVEQPVGNLFGRHVGSVKDGRLPGDNFTNLVHGRNAFDWPLNLKANDSCPEDFHEFLLINADIDDAFWHEARLLPLSDVVLVLDDYVSPEAECIEFTRNALERFKGTTIWVVVYSKNHLAQALDIYCQFENFVSSSNPEGMSFLGHLPKYKKDHRYSTIETIGLQNIAFSLLNLNYQPIPHNILSELGKGSLH